MMDYFPKLGSSQRPNPRSGLVEDQNLRTVTTGGDESRPPLQSEREVTNMMISHELELGF